MRGHYVTNALSVSAILAVLGFVCATGTSPKRFQLVGFTTQTFLGGAGVLGFTLACQAEFPASRMCTSQEVLETVTVPTNLIGDAWVRPSYEPSPEVQLDASGVATNVILPTCGSWTASVNGPTGLTVDSVGGFRANQLCAVARAVACCAMVP